MSSGKKGRKKGKTLALQDFLQETPGVVATLPIRKSNVNWADEVEEQDGFDIRSSKPNVILPTAPKASRDYDDIIEKVPQEGPYIAYLSNLPYDVDENEIAYFFRNMKIANMRIPKDDRPSETPRLKGFGYVEFEDRESLLNALVIPDTTLKNRRIRIEVATDYGDDKRRPGRMDMNRDRNNRSDSSMGDWRSGPRTETSDNDRRGFNKNRDRDDSRNAWRDGDRHKEPERSFSRSSDRYDKDQEITRSKDRDRDRDEGGFMSRRYDDREKGSRNGGFSRRDEEPQKNEPKRRPKLVLAPRSKPLNTEPEVAQSAAIFGNAKPVDTSARERQIEERLAKLDVDPPRRDASKDRKDVIPEKEHVIQREKREQPPEPEKKHYEPKSHNQKSDPNGIIEKTDRSHQKRNEHEKKDLIKDHNDKHNKYDKQDNKRRDDKKEKPEKEMPKMKAAEAPNFIGNNKFAFLDTEDNSD